MKLTKFIEFLRNRLKTVIWISCAILVMVVVLDAIPAVVDMEHAHTRQEHWAGFWAVFGFAACVVIILASKWFGHLGIMTREDYYEAASSDVTADRSAAFRRQNVASDNALPPKGGAPGSKHGHTPKGGHHE